MRLRLSAETDVDMLVCDALPQSVSGLLADCKAFPVGGVSSSPAAAVNSLLLPLVGGSFGFTTAGRAAFSILLTDSQRQLPVLCLCPRSGQDLAS